MPHVSAAVLRELGSALIDSRSVATELLEGVTDDQLVGEPAHFVEPPIWELGHVGWFQEYWLLRHLIGAAPLLPGSDQLYDSFHIPYRTRFDLRYPSRTKTLAYVSDVLARSLGRLESGDLAEHERYFYTLAAQHEDMHTENLTLTLQTRGCARPALRTRLDRLAPTELSGDRADPPRDVDVPGGEFGLGASEDEPFVFDNEKWTHPVDLNPFRICSTLVPNADFVGFVEDDGYVRRELWSRRGWQWLQREGAKHPLFWRKIERVWCERLFDELVPLRPWHPVVGINWHEAQAFCRWAGRRLPTEAEWEKAATFDPRTGNKRRFPWGSDTADASRANLDFARGGTLDVRALPAGDSAAGCRQMIGNVWEWVEDTFQPFPGFVCDPYAEYSKPYFGEKKVLRGGSWATRSRVARSTYRNFYKSHRRNLFAGFRTCALTSGEARSA